MADISYDPIFTYIGLNKISKALQDSSTIQLTHLGLGDAKNNLDYNVTPDDTTLKNELIRISISTITFSDMIASNSVLMNITGILPPQDAPNMVIREYGIYDNEGDLIIICRYPDYHTMQTGMPITNMVFRSTINLINNAAAFTEDYYGSGDHTTVEEFNTHVNDYNNPHNVDHTHIPGLENLDNTSPEMKPFNQNNQDLFTDGKFAIGFTNRVDSKITNTSDTIILENNIVDLIGIEVLGSYKYLSSILANGKIYGVPHSATQVLEIDPENDTTTLIGNVYNGINKWVGAVLAPNGKMYCIPRDYTQVLKIDPVNKTTTLIGDIYSGTGKWYGAVLAPNGKIYCAPYNATQVLEIDPENDTTTLIGNVYVGTDKWQSVVLAPNGKMYCIPFNATQVLEIDPNTKTTTLVGDIYSGDGKYNAVALADNGKIYCAPRDATQVLEIDPETGATTLIGSSFGGAQKWLSAVLVNNKIYCAPYSASQVLEIDPITKTTTLIGNVYSGDAKWQGATLAPNGKIYCAPRLSTQTLEISPETGITKLIGKIFTSVDKYSSSVLAPNGNIYALPNHIATQVLKIRYTDSYSVYKYGVKHNIDIDLSITVEPDSSGYIGYDVDSNSLYYIGDYPNFSTDILVAWYYSNATDGIIWVNDERHGVARNTEYHRLTHNETGAIWRYGGELTTPDFTKLNIANFGIADEDLEFDISHASLVANPFEQVLVDAKLPVLYVSNGKYRRAFNNNTLNWLYDLNGAVYNDINSGLLVDVPENKYLTYIVLFTTSIKEPVKLVVGIDTYATENDAENESFESYGLPMPELVAAYRIILHKNSAYANLAKTKITKIVTIRNINDGGKIDLTNHSLFTDRFNGIQHPTSAIIGLDQALAEAGKLKDIELVGTMKSKLSVDEITREATLTTFQSDSTNMPAIYGGGNPNGESRVLISEVGDAVPLVGSYLLTTAAIGPDGKIYACPRGSGRPLVYDPDTQKWEFIGTNWGDNQNYWMGIAAAPNGKLYCFPHAGTGHVLEIDPATKTTALINTPYMGEVSAGKYCGAILAPNGNIYGIPMYSPYVLELNVQARTTSFIGANLGTGTYKWADGALAPNGKIYCAPLEATQVLEIDPVTKTTTLIGSVYSGTGNWVGAALAPNGKIYCAPRNATRALEIDPVTKTTTLIGSVYSGDGKWESAALAPNGKIYCMPYNATQILEIDPITKITRLLPERVFASGGLKYNTAISAPDGAIYTFPCNTTNRILKLEILSRKLDIQKTLIIPDNITN